MLLWNFFQNSDFVVVSYKSEDLCQSENLAACKILRICRKLDSDFKQAKTGAKCHSLSWDFFEGL